MRSGVIVTQGICVGVIALLSIGSLLAQVPAPRGSRTSGQNPDADAYRQIQRQRAIDAQARTVMREAEANARASATLPREKFPTLTEKDRKRIEALLSPNPDDVAAHKEFLEQERTGIFRLFANSNCETKNLIRVDGDCANHIPGGSNYSFRPGATTPDIHFNNGQLIGEGFFSEVIVAELGSLSIDDALSTAQLRFLHDFVSAADFADALKQHADVVKGINSNGITYSNKITPKLDKTYAARIIAYRNGNNLLRRLPLEGLSLDNKVIAFQKVQTDNRLDLLVVFRIIRREADGNITLLWKEIERRKSPVITFRKDQELSDFK